MNRRTFTKSLIWAAASAKTSAAFPVSPTTEGTRWKVRTSVGFDAILFLDALSGGELCAPYYSAEAAAFKSKLPDRVSKDIEKLWAEARSSSFGLLGPNLCVLFSEGNDITLR
jgi:hypothetical protein